MAKPKKGIILFAPDIALGTAKDLSERMGGKWGRLTQARKDAGYTQSMLASFMEMSSITLSRWETASELPESAVALVKLARLLDVSLDWLLYNEDASIEVTAEERKILDQAAEILTRKNGKK